MTATVWLGRLGGVRVGVHWSVLGIVAILVTLLAFARWPRLLPGYSAGAYLLAGVVAAALFVVSLLAHELAHALVAKRNGLEVDHIVLWLLGGVAQLRGEARTPGIELRVAGVGPLVSLVAGVVFGALALAAGAADVDLLVTAVLSYLALINVILAVFNLIPAAPLDGGRILRAALWAWRGDRHRATVWSARAGRVFGFLLIGYGAVQLLVGTFGGGLWAILIGLFVVNVATAEERQAELGAALAGLRVRDVMTSNPDTVDGDVAVSEFLREVALVRRHSAFPILDPAGRFQGMVTLNRLRSVRPQDRDATLLRDVACPPGEVPLAEPDEPITGLLARMDGCTDGRALVFDEDRLAGIVTPSDISRMVTLHGLGTGWRSGADLTTPESNPWAPRR
ncbi:Zn-dependent protease (includes SpoIVFB) [Amycolatopsis arida]|uniref:Zinc metalloprotease n=1 Tax=Amycolatopsis arida TaxID=587909 RepID=A0A1I5YXK5_9PSEU|nr:site-2 protease family protein [Amycolatopsis arida]TDX89960.1 Zn-dependent protease [Amycolatopsis arida]SFQ48944.1 Zn-dependent protease (includes SpoIVFB) [Amycolatopsis arida]